MGVLSELADEVLHLTNLGVIDMSHPIIINPAEKESYTALFIQEGLTQCSGALPSFLEG